jgi:pimeloyl-ACP methyl ester carboxylesterase
VPTLLLHGDDDQIVPIDVTARRAVKMIAKAELKVYPGADHGICTTHKDRVATPTCSRSARARALERRAVLHRGVQGVPR